MSILSQLPSKAELLSIADEHGRNFRTAQPYPCGAIDNVFSNEVLDTILYEFPKREDSAWVRSYESKFSVGKWGSGKEELWGENTRIMMHYLNSQVFLAFLEKLTGIDDLIPDPDFSGAGLFNTLPGGLLKLHADFNKHPRNMLDRRVNVLIYLNKEWEESYGGHLELWDPKMTACGVKILPIFNRMGIFCPTSYTWHGHPDPLNCPDHQSRKSLALFYYTNGRPDHEVFPGNKRHSTIWKLRKGADDYLLNKKEKAVES